MGSAAGIPAPACRLRAPAGTRRGRPQSGVPGVCQPEAAHMTRVTVVSPEPTPYRAPLLDRIAARDDIDLTVIYAARTVAGRTWSVAFHHRAIFLGGVRAPGLKRLFRHDYPI